MHTFVYYAFLERGMVLINFGVRLRLRSLICKSSMWSVGSEGRIGGNVAYEDFFEVRINAACYLLLVVIFVR